MFRLSYTALTALLLFSMVALQAHASGAGLNVFLRQYINQSTINSATFYNESVGAGNYSIMGLLNGQIVVINQTGGYKFVLNNTAAYTVLRPWALSTFAPSNASLSQLYGHMHTYEVTAAKNLSPCLQITGLNQKGSTCTAFNGCYSCASVPICKKAMQAYGGPSYAFAYQIGNLSIQYDALNASYNAYYSALTSFTPSNAYQSLLELQKATANVSNDAAILKTNGLFPPPPGFNPSIQRSCPALPSNNSPWYCQIFDFCTYPYFNASQIYTIQASLTNLLSEPLSNGSIEGVAANATGAALSYLAPQEKVQLNVIIGQQYGRFNATFANASLLSSEYYNLTLQSRLAAYRKTFTDLLAYNLRLNATGYNGTLNAQHDNLTLIYNTVYAHYNVVHSLANNNTAALLVKELDFQIEPPQLASLSFLQQSINTQLAAGINESSYNGIYAKLVQVKSGIGIMVAPITGPTLVKYIDGPIITALLAGSSAPVPAKMASGAFYVLIISLIVVAIIAVLVYFLLFRRLSKRGKVHLHQRAKRAWMLLFIAIIVIGAVLSYLLYAYAQQANGFLPISGFISQLNSHSSVVIAYNGSAASSDASILQCTATLQQTLQSSLGKQVGTVTLDNYSCVSSSNSIYSQPNCFDQLLASGTPVIVVTENANSSIIYRGIYGHALYAGGAAVSGPECQLNAVIKVQ